MSSQSKADEAADECPPSYEESAITPLGRMLSGPGIVSEIEFRRQEVVRSAIENHVLPNLRRQAKYGIAKSATVLEPCQTDMPDQKSNDGKISLKVSRGI